MNVAEKKNFEEIYGSDLYMQGMRYRQDRRGKCCQQPVSLRGAGSDVGV